MTDDFAGPWFVLYRNARSGGKYLFDSAFANAGAAGDTAKELITQQPSAECLVVFAYRRYRASIAIEASDVQLEQPAHKVL